MCGDLQVGHSEMRSESGAHRMSEVGTAGGHLSLHVKLVTAWFLYQRAIKKPSNTQHSSLKLFLF